MPSPRVAFFQVGSTTLEIIDNGDNTFTIVSNGSTKVVSARTAIELAIDVALRIGREVGAEAVYRAHEG